MVVHLCATLGLDVTRLEIEVNTEVRVRLRRHQRRSVKLHLVARGNESHSSALQIGEIVRSYVDVGRAPRGGFGEPELLTAIFGIEFDSIGTRQSELAIVRRHGIGVGYANRERLQPVEGHQCD
jgi:hypothetical protein